MKTKLPIFILLILAGAGGSAYWLYFKPPEVADGQIRVSGNIETTEVQVAFKIPGRVMRRFVDEGQKVAAGQPVAQLDTADLQSNVDLRKAELGVAEAALAALKAGSRPQEIETARSAMEKAAHALSDLEAGSRPQEIAAADAAVAAADAEKSRANADYRRATVMLQRKAISAEDYDAAKAAYDVAVEKHRQSVEQLKLAKEGFRKEQIEQARWALTQAKAQYDLVKEGPRKEDIDQGIARVAQAKAALKYAETQLSYATVVSPLTGVVLSKNVEEGDYVAPGTAVVTVGDMDNVWLRAYIEETDLGRVSVGQRAWITTDSFTGKAHDKLEGRVSFLAENAEFTPKNVQTQKERVKLVYRIKIDIKNPIAIDPRTKKPTWELKPGMPADAVIEAK
jgi:HlyD family secretion protein